MFLLLLQLVVALGQNGMEVTCGYIFALAYNGAWRQIWEIYIFIIHEIFSLADDWSKASWSVRKSRNELKDQHGDLKVN